MIVALSFGMAGALFGLHRFAVDTLKHIVTSDPSLSFQEVNDYLPVPRKLDWNVPAMQFLSALRDIRGPVLFITAVLILLMLGALFVWVVGQAPERPEASTFADSAAERPEAEAALDNLASPPAAHAEPEGVGGGYDGGEFETPAAPIDLPAAAHTDAPRRPSRVFATVAFLVGAATLVFVGVPPISQTLLRYYHTLGTLHTGYYLSIATSSVASVACIWIAVGLTLYAICAARRNAVHRLSVVLIASLCFAFALWRQAGLSVRAVSNQYDWSPAILTVAPPYNPDRNVYGVPEGYYAAQLLGGRLNLAFGEQKEQPARPMMLFVPSGVVNLVSPGFSEDGLTASAESALPVRKYLERKHYETALSWEALKHLFNVATVHFDTTSAMDVCMTDMEKCPHLSQCGMVLRSMLFTCSATAPNIALIDRWADERLYAHPTRESQRLMGQLYERMGEKEKALVWYRRADMPKSFLARVRDEKPLFHTGRLTGTILLNGRPLAGVQVGAVPRRLNGLPRDMEPMVIHSRAELIAYRPRGRFPPHHPRPFALRWISAAAVTDASGRFDISSLTEGEYMLVCTLPPALHLQTPVDPGIVVTNAPAGLTVNYANQTRDLGTIAIKTHK